MKSKHDERGELCLRVRLLASLEEAIDSWLAARDAYRLEPTDENQNEYNTTYFELGTAFGARYPEAANTPDAFRWYLRGLIAPETDG